MSATTFTLNQTPDDKCLPLNSIIECNVSPMVIMSILNHYQRRPANRRQKQNQIIAYPSFVIGLLFGRKNPENNSLIINDTFGLETQIQPNNNQIALDLSMAKDALKLHSMAHPLDRLVGWYRTGLQIEHHSTSLHDSIIVKQLSVVSNKLCKNKAGELDDSEYIHLLCDTSLKNNKLSIKAYSAVPIMDPIQETQYNDYIQEKKRRDRLSKQQKQKTSKQSTKSRKQRRKKKSGMANDMSQQSSQRDTPAKDQKQRDNEQDQKDKILQPLVAVEKPYSIFSRFRELKCTYLASESERIGLEMIIESPPEGNSLDSPALLMNDIRHLESVLQNLLQNLETVQNYVSGVMNGDVDGNESIGWLIGDALCSVPNLSPARFEQMISNRLQDFLMMVYLAKMTKAQLVIADKINKVLPSTVPGFEQ